jgi:Mn2+/Fe2+ NRAMP family transporter
MARAPRGRLPWADLAPGAGFLVLWLVVGGWMLHGSAGDATFLLFSLGIIGTGMLAVPVLAGSAAYAVAEAFEWKSGLDLKLLEAREFYAIIALATLGGVLLDFTPIDPIKALFWSAVINGVIAVPIMIVMMLLADDARVMGDFTVTRRLKALGWLATWTMAAAVVAMFAGGMSY